MSSSYRYELPLKFSNQLDPYDHLLWMNECVVVCLDIVNIQHMQNKKKYYDVNY